MPRKHVGIDLNKCCSFNGTTSAVTFVATTAFNPANMTNFTVALWLNARTMLPTTAARVFDLQDGGAGKGFRFFAGNTSTVNGFRFDVLHTSTAGSARSGNGTILPGKWYRLLATWNNSENTPKIYINGADVTANTVNKSGTRDNISGGTVAIGLDSVADNNGLDGLIDEVCIWNRVLTTAEIQRDYFAGEIASSGLILHFNMDEETGDLADSSATGITGTVANVTQDVDSYTTGTRTIAT